jgi:hypothetical protein
VTRWLLLVVLLGCEREPLERLEPPPVVVAQPPPPPPPPAREMPAPMPEQFRELSAQGDAWRVTFFALGNEPGPFLGAKPLHSRVLGASSTTEVIDWLRADTTYVVDTDTRGCGWVTPELGIEVARGTASLRMRYNCGYLFFGPDERPRAMASSDAVVRFMEIEERSGFAR